MGAELTLVNCPIRSKFFFDVVAPEGPPLEKVKDRRYNGILVENDEPTVREVVNHFKSLGGVEWWYAEPDLGNIAILPTILRAQVGRLIQDNTKCEARAIYRALCIVTSSVLFRERGLYFMVEVFDRPSAKVTQGVLFPAPLITR